MADNNIQNFVSYISNATGFARPTRYRVDIGIQALLTNPNVSDWFKQLDVADIQNADRLAFMCDRAQLPAKAFNAVQVRTYGPSVQMPFQAQYPNVTLEFYVGQDMLEKMFFDAWMYAIEDPSSMDISYLNDFSVNMLVSQLPDFSTDIDDATYQILFLNAWPIAIQGMDLDYSAVDQFHRVQVTFAYRRWLSGGLDIDIITSVIPDGTVQSFSNFIGVNR